MKSYVTQFAGGTNGARVDAKPRSYGSLVAVADMSAGAAPRLVVVDPAGEHAAVERDRVVDILYKGGVVRRSAIADEGVVRSLPFATDQGVILAPVDVRWDGSSATQEAQRIVYARAIDEEGAQLAVSLQGGRWIVASQERATRHREEGVHVSSASLTDKRAFWMGALPGRAVAAIAADGRVVLGTAEGHLVVYAADGDPRTNEGVVAVDVALERPASFVSAIAPGVVALAVTAAGATRATGLDDAGKVVWTADVPFAARQPAIDGGEGRTYVVGDGLAALRGGAVLWSARADAPMSATAFGDGTLAVCVGAALRIVDAEGHVRSELQTPDRDPILTPPAIGPDGAVWIATRKSVLVTH